MKGVILCQLKQLICSVGLGGLTHGFVKAGIPVVAGIDIDATCEFAYTENNNSQIYFCMM